MTAPRILKALFLVLVLSAGLAPDAWSQVNVSNAWVRGTVAQQKATGAFMTLTSVEGARLIDASSPVAGAVEIHEMTMDNNVMRMRQIAGLDLPAGKPVELKPGGFHVMLMNLRQPLAEGDTVPLTLTVEGQDKKRQSIELKVPVRALATPAAQPHQHKH